ALREAGGAVLRPVPVHAAVERVGTLADLALLTVSVEIACRHQHAGDEERGIDQREFALPDAPAGPHVEEMIIEALVAGGIGCLALGTVQEEAQHLEGPARSLPARKPAVLYG